MGACRHFGNIQFRNSNISIHVIVYTVSSARRVSWLTVALTRVLRRIESATFRATIVDAFIIPSTCIRGRDIVVTLLVIPSTCIRERDIVIAPLVIPSTCIRERDIVIAPLVRVYVCLSVCVSKLSCPASWLFRVL